MPIFADNRTMDFVSYYIQQILIRGLGPLRFQFDFERSCINYWKVCVNISHLLYCSLYYLDAAVYIISCTLYFNIIASIFWMPSSSLASWYSGTSRTLHLVPLSFKRSSENPDVILMCFSICVTCDFFFSFSFQYFLFCIFNVLSIL